MRKMRVYAVAVLGLLLLTSASYAQRESTARNRRAAVGKLGQFNQPAPVYVKPDRGSRILYRGTANLYVVLRNLKDDWATIVMADGSSGYVEAKFLDRLPYEVNIREGTGGASRGGLERSTNQVVQSAMQFLGTPYKWGGNDMRMGIDCSGFVKQLFGQVGVSLPRTAEEQSFVGRPVDRLDELQPGDRLYFTNGDRLRITHTGIYIGNGYFIHSSRGNAGVAVDYLADKWLRTLISARR